MSPDAYLEMAETESRHWWFAGRRRILDGMLRQLKLPRCARILEIGSGTGGNLIMLSKYGQVSAIEMDETAREIANQKTKGKFDIKAGCCPSQIPFVQEKFDLICLFDVLEHIPDDIGTLNKLKELLAPGGRIFITVPAHPWLWGAHDQYLHHQRRYRAAQFREMLIDTGYRIRKYTYFNTLLFPFAALVRIKERLTSSKVAGGGAVPVAPLNALFRQLFGFEAYILPRINLPYGVSLMAIIDAAPDANEKSSIDAK